MVQYDTKKMSMIKDRIEVQGGVITIIVLLPVV